MPLSISYIKWPGIVSRKKFRFLIFRKVDSNIFPESISTKSPITARLERTASKSKGNLMPLSSPITCFSQHYPVEKITMNVYGDHHNSPITGPRVYDVYVMLFPLVWKRFNFWNLRASSIFVIVNPNVVRWQNLGALRSLLWSATATWRNVFAYFRR